MARIVVVYVPSEGLSQVRTEEVRDLLALFKVDVLFIIRTLPGEQSCDPQI